MKLVLLLAVLVCVVQCLPMSQDELEDFSNFLLKTSSLDIHVKSADTDDSYDEDEVISDHAWEDSGKFEGDLILNDRQRRLIVENVEGLSRNGLTDSTKRWPNNEVIYFIQREHFTSGQVQAIQDGIDDLARASCVKFRPYKKGDRDAVVIQGSRRGCFSQVGYQGGYQVLNLSGRHPVGRGCFRHGTVVHELLHSLGFYHMQSSPDRDDYIDVIWANIVQPARHNFRKYNSFSVSDFGVGYDYDSVLHYSRRAFSANGQDTLVPKKSGAEIGQRVGLSDKDTQKLNKMYCDANNDPALQADENTTTKQKNKKKKPKNQPFEGHGIGYHQGKTVVIKLPAAETYKLPNFPTTTVFDFSKTPQIVSPEAGGYRFGEEITYSYKPEISLNTETTGNDDLSEVGIVNKNIEKHQGIEESVEPPKHNKKSDSSSQRLNNSDEFKPKYVPLDDYDKDLQEAFHRLTKIVKQHVYPLNNNYDHKINKDYSKFYRPLRSDSESDSLDDKSEQSLSSGSSSEKLQNQTHVHGNSDDVNFSELRDKMDISYRTALPTKKPYSSFEQTETPIYATLEYLKNRHDFSKVYQKALKPPYDNTHEHENVMKNQTKYEDDLKINPYDEKFYTDYVKNAKNLLTSTPKPEKDSKIVNKPSKYELEENSRYAQRTEEMDSSYRTLIPTTKPYSAYEQTETPKYATLEYIKDRHEISDVYPPKTNNHYYKKEKIPYAIKDPLTENNWYTKGYNKHNPAHYDRDSYSDYVQTKLEGQDKDKHDNDAELHDSLSKPKHSADFSYEEEEKYSLNTNDPKNKEILLEHEQPRYTDDDYDYYAKYHKGDNDNHSFETPYDSGDNSKESAKHQSHDNAKAMKYDQNYFPEYTKEQNSGSAEESSDKDSKELPKKSNVYKLNGVPVPLTNDWYSIPESNHSR